MLLYLLKRLGLAVLIVVLAVIILYSLIHIVPGDPVSVILGPRATPEMKEILYSWGSILHNGYSFIRNTPWLVISGGFPLILTTLGFTFLGESLRDIFDPKLQKDL